MEGLAELQAMFKRLDAKWESGDLGSPSEFVEIDRQRKELKRRLLAMSKGCNSEN